MTALQLGTAQSMPVLDSTAVFLHPGDVACGTRGDRFETLLGSCVAIVLTDPRRTVGAICHIVHANLPKGDARSETTYGAPALAWMMAQLRMLGIEPRLCDAYVYGGGNMFPSITAGPHVGDKNARWALGALGDAGVRVLAQDVGGHGYRRLRWSVGHDQPQITTTPV